MHQQTALPSPPAGTGSSQREVHTRPQVWPLRLCKYLPLSPSSLPGDRDRSSHGGFGIRVLWVVDPSSTWIPDRPREQLRDCWVNQKRASTLRGPTPARTREVCTQSRCSPASRASGPEWTLLGRAPPGGPQKTATDRESPSMTHLLCDQQVPQKLPEKALVGDNQPKTPALRHKQSTATGQRRAEQRGSVL